LAQRQVSCETESISAKRRAVLLWSTILHSAKAELYGYHQAQSPRPREVVHGLPAAIIDAFSLLYPADVRRRQNIQGAPRLRASSRCRVHPRGNRPPMRRLFDDGGSCARSPWNRINNKGCSKVAGSFSMVESSMATPPWLSLFRSSLRKLATIFLQPPVR